MGGKTIKHVTILSYSNNPNTLGSPTTTKHLPVLERCLRIQTNLSQALDCPIIALPVPHQLAGIEHTTDGPEKVMRMAGRSNSLELTASHRGEGPPEHCP